MCEKYSRSLLRISVAQICQNLGWNSAQSSSLEVLTDVLERYILKIGGTCRKFSEEYGRTEVNLNDLGLAFQQLGISISELEDYVHHVEPVPFAHEVVAFPAPKPSNLGFPNPRSREIVQHREEHIPEHLPYMFPNMKDEIPEDRTASPINGPETPLKAELNQENGDKEDVNVGDKRPASLSTPDLPPSKRPRFGNSNLPEEAGHSQYEMTCVFMGPNGVLTTRQGCQGRLPEPRMPPPNPRTLSEGANKENSGKTKDSAGGPKISISVGGIGAESLSSGKNESKKSRKSPQKKKTLHEMAAKISSEELGKELMKKSSGGKISVDGIGKKSFKNVMDGMGKEIGKKSVSSKAAAKFLKKLKLSKKSSKLFTKSKIKDQKSSDFPKNIISSEKAKKLMTHANVDDGKRKKEKKSAAIIDSEEELRNLSSPSSRVPSPELIVITDADGGAKTKALMEAIDDSINAVLREVPAIKMKKRKKKEDKTEEASGDLAVKGQSDGKAPEPKIKRKPGRPPKVQKPPEPPPPVDVKPFVSDKYSSEELQVYEFNDSPPDTSISSRRPSAAETVAPPLVPPTPPPPQPVVKHESAVPTTKHGTSSGSSSYKFHRRVEPEDDLFAPEIKFESRADHSDTQKTARLDVSKDKEKQKPKNEKKERNEEEKGSQKNKDEKVDRHKDKDKKEKYKEEKDRFRDDREKHKEKEHKKKEKRKDKEKKKRHKFKDHEKDKEKEKRPEEKVKQEARESRESSPAVGIGVKLKIKIGGGNAGASTSMMVTGESNSPASPASTLTSKRKPMSPPRVVPKLYISKKGQGTEEKAKKSSISSLPGSGSKHKSSPLAVTVKSHSPSPSSNKTSPSPRSTPTPPVPRKTPTPPPNPKSVKKGPHSPHGKSAGIKGKESVSQVPAKERQSRSPIKDRSSKSEGKKKKERKPSLSSLSSDSSSPSPSPSKSSLPRRLTPPRLERMSSSSPEKSPPTLPFQSSTPSPRTSSSAARSLSRMSSPHHSPTPPPSLSRRKPTPPPALSPSHSLRRHSHSPSPARPPTPGSTSPPPSPDWNLSSPAHPRSPTPTPRTPTASPSRNIPSPSHSSPPGSPVVSHRSPSPAHSTSRPGSRLLQTPEPVSNSKDNLSPASSGKSSTSLSKQSRTVEAETVCVFYDDSGQKVWICPACKLPDDGSEMIGCDMCDNWYHWPCVGITEAPPEEQQWFCCKCLPKTKSSIRGRGRPRGRGRGRGRKKIT